MDLFIEPQQNSYEWQGRSRVASSRGASAAPSEPCGGVRAKDACSSYPVPAAWRDEAYSLEQESYREELAFHRGRARRRKLASAAHVACLVVLVPLVLVAVFVASYVLTCIMNGATPDEVAGLLQGLWARVEGFVHEALSGL